MFECFFIGRIRIMENAIYFLLGTFLGSMADVFVMCINQINHLYDRKDNHNDQKKYWKTHFNE